MRRPRKAAKRAWRSLRSIATAKGPWLAKRFKPLPASQDRRTHRVVEVLAVRRVASLKPLARLNALPNARERTRPYCDMWDEYYPNGSFSVPFTILAFHEQDLVCQAFQSDEEDWMNGGEQQSPAFAIAFSPSDPECDRGRI